MKSIRTLTLTVVLGLLLAVTAASYLVNEYVGYRRFIDIEEADVRRDLQVINGLFESRAEDMQRLSRDWAYWTDTAEFIRGRLPEYVTANLSIQTFHDQNLSHIVFVDSAGKQTWGGYETGKKLQAYALSPELTTRLAALLESSKEKKDGAAGFLRLDGKLALVSVLPVLHSDHSGPSPGWMFMARLPGPDMEKSLSGQFGGELTFAAPDDQLQASALGGMQWKEADGIHVACEEDAVHGVMRLPGCGFPTSSARPLSWFTSKGHRPGEPRRPSSMERTCWLWWSGASFC